MARLWIRIASLEFAEQSSAVVAGGYIKPKGLSSIGKKRLLIGSQVVSTVTVNSQSFDRIRYHRQFSKQKQSKPFVQVINKESNASTQKTKQNL